jgi:alkylated DNA repair dioxygenase AlkB
MNTPIRYYPRFINNPDEAFKALWNELEWVRYDKVPRREYYCNDVSRPYKYGLAAYARTYDPQPWHPVILDIKNELEKFTGSKFEVCFLNGYENQSDHLGWHADDSPEMDDERPIAIISLGVEREIWFRPNPSIIEESITTDWLMSTGMTIEEARTDLSIPEKLKLENGSLCLMLPGMQDTHQHRIPKASFMCGERISLTFRGYV